MFPLPDEPPSKRQKRVRIAENDDGTLRVDAMDDVPPISPEEEASLWYTPQEISSIRRDVRESVDFVLQNHQLDPSNFKSYTNSYILVFTRCCDCETGPRHQEMLRLIHWIKSCPASRGLERRSLPSIERERKKKRQEHVQTILSLYKNHDGNDDGSGCVPTPTVLLDEVVARKSEDLSRSARLFAMCLAICDAVAAREEPIATARRRSIPERGTVTPHQPGARGA